MPFFFLGHRSGIITRERVLAGFGMTVDRTNARWVRETLTKSGLRLHKALGQNFLVDANIRDRIVEACDLSPSDMVVEIGPGLGALTARLAEKGQLVLALEYDRGLHELLTAGPPGRNVIPILGDARRADFDALAATHTDGLYGSRGRPYKLVGNLPYYLTGSLLWRLVTERINASLMVFMLQAEAAGRLLAAPGDHDYGALTVAVQYLYRPEAVRRVPRTVFLPVPEVDSVVVRLAKRDVPPVKVPDEALFFQLVRASFANRRKKLANSLVNQVPGHSRAEWTSLLAAAGIDPDRRGETLSLAEFAALAGVAWREHMVEGGLYRCTLPVPVKGD